LHQATKGISDLITIPGLINCDFADVRTVMLEMGDALMGTGFGSGDDKASDAALQAISSPLLEDVSIGGAKGILINVTGGEDMTLFDVNNATTAIYDEAGSDANIIFGAVIDPAMNDQIRVTVIATGIGEKEALSQQVADQIAITAPGGTISMFPEESEPVAAKVTEPMPIGYAAEHPERFGHPPKNDDKCEEDAVPGGRGVPLFSQTDSNIPAYLRRLEDKQ